MIERSGTTVYVIHTRFGVSHKLTGASELNCLSHYLDQSLYSIPYLAIEVSYEQLVAETSRTVSRRL